MKKRRRAKGTGCLVVRGGIYHARWVYNGMVRQETTGIRTDEQRIMSDGRVIEARELAENYLMDRTEFIRLRHREDARAMLLRQLSTPEERLRDDIEAVKHRATVGDLPHLFEQSPRRPDCSAAMLVFYKRIIGQFAESVGADVAIGDVDARMAGRYAAEIGGRSAAGTFNKAINALSLVWKSVGKDLGMRTDDNPWLDITRKKSDAHERRCFTDAEVAKILETATGEVRVLFAVGLYTGLRLGDAVHIKWDDFKDGDVYVKTAKTGARVAIPTHPRLEEIVGERKRTGLVMPTLAAMYDNPKKTTQVNRRIKQVIEAVGIKSSYERNGKRARPESGFHSCRVYFVSSAVAAGVPIDVVRGIVGHTETRMTEHYYRVESDAAREALKKMR